MQVAVIGMGRMGRALGERLLASGHGVRVWNRTAGRADDLVAAGASEARSPADAAGSAQVAITALTDDAAVSEVCAGSEGVWSALTQGQVLIDATTVAADTSRRLASGTPGGRFLAAPILGSPQATAAGQAVLLVGGPRAIAESLEPLFDDLASQHRFCGEDPGLASAMKLLSNYLLMAGIGVLAEVVATAERLDLGADWLREFLGQSPLVAPGLHNRLDDVLCGQHEGWFTTELAAKDVRLAGDLARSVGIELPLARLVEKRLVLTAQSGYQDADLGAIIEPLRSSGS